MPGLDGLDGARLHHERDAAPGGDALARTRPTGRRRSRMRALDYGAVDFVAQALGHRSRSTWSRVADRLLEALRGRHGTCEPARVPMRAHALPAPAHPRRAGGAVRAAAARPWPWPERRPRRRVVVIAASTGGPRALAELVPRLPARRWARRCWWCSTCPRASPARFAERLDGLGALPVSEAERRRARAGADHVYMAPGDYHMRVVRRTGVPRIALEPGADRCGACARPPTRSSAVGGRGVRRRARGRRAHRDGPRRRGRGCAQMRTGGGAGIAQDRRPASIYGMPHAALATAGADRIVALGDAAAAIAAAIATR